MECKALEPKLYQVKDLLVKAEDGGSVWKGKDAALRGKEEAERRYQDLLDKLHENERVLNASGFVIE